MKTIQIQKHRGQALPIAIAAMLMITLLGLLVFNTSQTTSEKMRLTNTADAAAYSGMIWQARALNFYSYTNRAMVANQVSIAQIISFISWSKYLRIAARNINNTIGMFPPARPYTQAFYNISMQINEYLVQFGGYVIKGLDYLLEVLSWSQTIVQFASVAATVDIINEVVKRNDPTYSVSTAVSGIAIAENTMGWLDGFTKEYDNNAGLYRKANIINRSRDKWSRDRGWDWTLLSFSVGAYSYKAEIVKAGETRLLSRGDTSDTNNNDLDWEWKGKDTLSLHIAYTCWKRWRRRTCRNETPIGWGAAYSSTTDSDIEQQASCLFCQNQAWSRNKRAESYADDQIDKVDGYGGVRSYREIADLSEDNKDPRHKLAIEVKKDGGARTSSKIAGLGSPGGDATGSRNGIAHGMFAMEDNYASNEMSAIGKAEVYFRRPVPLESGQDEFGNLFNPYWDVHLTDPRNERMMSWGIKLAEDGGIGGMFE